MKTLGIKNSFRVKLPAGVFGTRRIHDYNLFLIRHQHTKDEQDRPSCIM